MRHNFNYFTLLLGLLCGAAASLQAQSSLPPDHPKLNVARQVFDELIDAVGDGRTPPQLQMLPSGVSSRRQLAWFNPRQHIVTLEERAYDLFVSMGPDSLDALAFLLAHELAHFYQNHGWVGDFGNGFADLEVGQALETLRQNADKIVELETQADYFGGFSGYIAGYHTLSVAPRALEAIYTAYGLGTDIPGYPALTERQEIARRSAARLQEMVPVFEAGHRFLLLLQYEKAARCFDFIARSFPSREILNNAGVARALQAVELFEADVLEVVYPLELDGTTRLRGGRKAEGYGYVKEGHAARDERRVRLLEQAWEWLERARSKDRHYAPAWINLACVADLQGEADEAALWAQQALKVARRASDPLPLAHAHLVRGIARLHGEPADEAGARQDFETARTAAPQLARLNLEVLDGVPIGRPASAPRAARLERIDGLSAQAYERANAPDAIVQIPRDGRDPAFTFYTQRAPGWEGLVVDTGYSTVVFLATRQNYVGETGQGLRIGDPLEQVVAAYGRPSYLRAGRLGTHHVYPGPGLVVRAGADDRVRGWILYHIEE